MHEIELNNVLSSAIDFTQVKAELCKRDFPYFCREFWQEADTSIPVWNWHMDYIAEELQKVAQRVFDGEKKESDFIINCPPGTSKSMIVSILFPAWCFAVNPKIRIITCSYSSTIALELSSKSRNLMQGNKYDKYFPDVKLKRDENQKGFYKTNQNGYRFVVSTNANTLGMHGDIIILDDPQNLDAVHSVAERERVNNWVTGTLSTRKTDKLNTPTIFVQQRLHRRDLTSYLLGRGNKYKHISLAATTNGKIIPEKLKSRYVNGYLDPIRLGEEALDVTKKGLGSYNYTAQIEQNPESDKNSIIKRKWIKIIHPGVLNDIIRDYEKKTKVYFIDTAYGGKDADYNAILECFVHEGVLYVTNLYKSKEEFPDLIKSIKNFCINGKKLYIEKKASGKSVISQLRSLTNYSIIELDPGGDDKLTRLRAISPDVEGGRVVMVDDNWNEDVLSEVCSNTPAYDDVRDVFTYAVNELLTKGSKKGKYDVR